MTTKQQRQQRRGEALKLISDGVPPTDAATQLSQTWGCSRRTSLWDIELAQSELTNALNSVEIQHMVGWLATLPCNRKPQKANQWMSEWAPLPEHVDLPRYEEIQ